MERSEAQRLMEFARINPLATASEASFDIITGLVKQIFDVPAVAITLIDHDTQYLVARQGIDVATTPRDSAICDIVVTSGEPLIIRDMQMDRRLRDHPAVVGAMEMGLRAYAGAPLTTRTGQHLGALCVLDKTPRSFPAERIDLLASFAALVSDQFELRIQAEKDFLTDTLNRRGFEAVLRREMGWISSGGPPATLAMLDLDHFKRVNDTYGHPVGDLMLESLAKVISRSLRKYDYVARLGGEEFALLLPDTRIEAGVEVMNRLRQTVAEHRIAGFPELALTVSIGLVDITLRDSDASAVLRDADAAVYLAKSKGRNQTISLAQGHPMRTLPPFERFSA